MCGEQAKTLKAIVHSDLCPAKNGPARLGPIADAIRRAGERKRGTQKAKEMNESENQETHAEMGVPMKHRWANIGRLTMKEEFDDAMNNLEDSEMPSKKALRVRHKIRLEEAGRIMEAMKERRRILTFMGENYSDRGWTFDIHNSSLTKFVDHPLGYPPMKLEMKIRDSHNPYYSSRHTNMNEFSESFNLVIDGIEYALGVDLNTFFELETAMTEVFQEYVDDE